MTTLTLKRNRYFTEPQQHQAQTLVERHPHARPPYADLSEDEATLLHAALTGFHPLEARASVRRARGLTPGDDVIDSATLTPKERAALPFPMATSSSK